MPLNLVMFEIFTRYFIAKHTGHLYIKTGPNSKPPKIDQNSEKKEL